MKLLDQFSNSSEADRISSRLRSMGILTYTSSSQSHMLSRVKTGALKVGLWVILDDQYDDAKALMGNPNHTPRVYLTEQEMIDLENETNQETLASRKILLEKIAAWVIACAMASFIAYILYGVINEA